MTSQQNYVEASGGHTDPMEGICPQPEHKGQKYMSWWQLAAILILIALVLASIPYLPLGGVR